MRQGNVKRTMIMLLALTVFTAPADLAFAKGEHGHNPEKKVEKLKEKLGLSAEQSTQIEGYLKAAGEKHKAIQEETKNQIDSVLTDEQKKKYAELREEMKQKMKEKFEKKAANRDMAY